MDIEHVTESGRAAIFARGGDSRPADLMALIIEVNRSSQAEEKLVLRSFHKREESCEVYDPRHVGIGELDAAPGSKLVHCSYRTPSATFLEVNTDLAKACRFSAGEVGEPPIEIQV